MPRKKTTEPVGERMRLEYVALSILKKWPRNPKDHAITETDKSMDRFGYTMPMLIDETSQQLVAGNGRLETLEARKAAGRSPPRRVLVDKAGEWYAPVIRGLAFESYEEALAYLLADNLLGELGGWDAAAYAATLAELDKAGTKLDGIGISPVAARKLIDAAATDAPERMRRTLEEFDMTPTPRRAWVLVAAAEDQVPAIEALLREKLAGTGARIEVSIGVDPAR